MPVPQFDVDVHVDDIDPDLLRLIFDDEVEDEGIGDNRLYFDVTGTTWLEVESIIEAEEALVMSVAENATDVDDFDRLIEQAMDTLYPGEDIDEGPLSDLSMLDLGVISAVAALAAAGCVSTTSRRGHRQTGEANPFVRFATDDLRLPHLREAAMAAKCGLLVDSVGMVQPYPVDVRAFIEFARQLLLRRGALFAIETPVSCARLDDEVLDQLDDPPRRRDLHRALQISGVDQVCDGQLPLFEPHE